MKYQTMEKIKWLAFIIWFIVCVGIGMGISLYITPILLPTWGSSSTPYFLVFTLITTLATILVILASLLLGMGIYREIEERAVNNCLMT